MNPSLYPQKTDSPLNHWSVVIARDLKERGNKSNSHFSLQSSISPSGPIHVGNFRDTIVVWAVHHMLLKLGEKAKFILCWDDADAVRSKGLPESEWGKPLSEAFLNNQKYSEIHGHKYQEELEQLGILPDVIEYQSNHYFKTKRYQSLIQLNVKKRSKLRDILNRYRENKLPKQWNPLVVYCEQCFKQILHYKIKALISLRLAYICPHCNYEHRKSLRESQFLKLSWRIDFPMRCHVDQIDFEPCGVDHFCYGSTMTTSRKILNEIYSDCLPYVKPYEFIHFKGQNRKISSSHGKVITLSDFCSIYPPDMVLWLFLKRRMLSPIIFSLSEDYFKNYREFQRFKYRLVNRIAKIKDKQIEDLLYGEKLCRVSPIDMKDLCHRAQALNFLETELLKYYCNIFPDASSVLLKSDLRELLPKLKYWLEHYANRKWVYSLAPPYKILESHVSWARNFIQVLESSSTHRIEGIDNDFYQMLFSKAGGPSTGSLINYWSKEHLKEHCQKIIEKEGRVGK